MQDKQDKKKKKDIKVRDMKPVKDAKGGFPTPRPNGPPWSPGKGGGAGQQ